MIDSRQIVFDKVLAAIRAQGRPSVNGGICSYRGCDGDKCPIGHLIPDESYKPEFEGKSLMDLGGTISKAGVYCIANVHRDIVFLSCLQRCHDTCDKLCDGQFMAFYENKMQAVATLYKLDYRPSVA